MPDPSPAAGPLMRTARWLVLAATLGISGCGSDAPPSSVAPADAAKEVSARAATANAAPGSVEVTAAETAASDPAQDREQTIDSALQLAEQGKLDAAAAELKRLLIAKPGDVEALFHLANMQATQGKLAEAIETLAGIPTDHPEAGLPALGQSADWCMQLQRYDDAEQRYQKILQQVPDAVRAHRQLAYLLNRQGRRHEAAVHVRELCKLGNVRQDELHSLIVLSDAMVSDANRADEDAVDYSPIGASGKARLLFTERRFSEAAEALRETIEQNDAAPSVVAFYGRILAEAQDEQAFVGWLPKTNAAVREYSEYWAAVAAYLSSQRQYEHAARCLLEALDRDPTDFRSINRLHQIMKLLEDPAETERWQQRWNANHKVLLANNKISDAATPSVETLEKLASNLLALDRHLEAVLWQALAAHFRGAAASEIQHWNQQRRQLVANGNAFPDHASRICHSDLDQFAMPDLAALIRSTPPPSTAPQRVSDSPAPAAFRNIAQSIGMKHAYQLAPQKLESGFAMYHQTGGGVAVLDYDCDGRADLYLAQGAADPPQFVSEQSNVLYRLLGNELRDITQFASAQDHRYTIGCTAGDWNQDGFADLITTNIGDNQLLINNGDGTFTAHALDGSGDLQRMPSSVAIADLTGDALPDIFELNYLQDPEIAKPPKRDADGKPIEPVGPGDFISALDRIGINDGTGRAVFAPMGQVPDDAHKGLGIVIADFDGRPGNDVFVGNDKSANQMWVRDDADRWSDIAVVNGSAFSYGGAGTASMGIAAGDFDHSGTLDLHVANFQNESVCLYLNTDGVFRDRAIQYKLGVPSRSVLGFGSQTIDYDNNGWLDLVVTNGHIDNYETMSGPFEQLPQLFCNLGDRFEEVRVNDDSQYWSQGHLGRALARVDLDRDGRNDFVVTHLNEPTAVLRNETAASGHWLQLQLVGTQSERDAIGAKITIHIGAETAVEWMAGGDGYLCRNEQLVSFGLGNATRIDKIVIDWPVGPPQTIGPVQADQRLLIIQNQSKPFPFPHDATKTR